MDNLYDSVPIGTQLEQSALAAVATFGAVASASLGGSSRGSRLPKTARLRRGHRKQARVSSFTSVFPSYGHIGSIPRS